jgi:hypothetical protein
MPIADRPWRPPVRATRRPGRRPKPDGHNKAARPAATRPTKGDPRESPCLERRAASQRMLQHTSSASQAVPASGLPAEGLRYGLPARPAARKDLDDGLALLQVAGLSLWAPARKGLVTFAVQAGSKQLLIPRAAMDVAAVRSFGLLGGLAPPSSATRVEIARNCIRAGSVGRCEGFRGLWPANT